MLGTAMDEQEKILRIIEIYSEIEEGIKEFKMARESLSSQEKVEYCKKISSLHEDLSALLQDCFA